MMQMRGLLSGLLSCLTKDVLTKDVLTKFSLIFSLGLLVSCSNSATPSESPTASPSASSSATPQTPSSSAATSSDTNRVLGADVTCDAPSHFAKIIWQQGAPYMTFGAKQGGNDLDSVPAIVTINPDVSLTYSAKVNYSFYSRFYPNGNCFVQVLDPNGAVSLEENGNMMIHSEQ
ncbi:MAG TPA: hypothetical protein V6C65_21350 [Allocoleopsis sp.]